MFKSGITIISILLTSTVFAQWPTVAGFDRESGPIGTIITIYGGNFNPIPSNNIVKFGRIRTPALSASPGELTVKVPPGASLHPVSVTIGGFTATSLQPFRVTFGNDLLIDSTSFANRVNFFWTTSTGNIDGPNGLESIDVNDDGKVDLVAQDGPQYEIGSVLRNLSVNGSISFGNPSFSFLKGKNSLTVFDYDCDGLDDIGYTTNNTDGSASALISLNNGSLAGTHFSSASGWGVGADITITSYGSTAADFNLDRRPDFAAVFRGVPWIQVARNTTTMPGNPEFGAKTTFNLNYSPTCMASGDLNGDYKPDLVVSHASTPSVFVYINTTVDSIITFANPIELSFDASEGSYAVKILDFDMDGRNDIVCLHDNKVSFRFNTSVPGSLSFAWPVSVSTNPGNRAFDFGDLNGDLKADLGIGGTQGYIQIFQNIGYLGGANFAPPIFLSSSNNVTGIVFADCNNDGLLDIAATNKGGPEAKTVSIFRNTIGSKSELCSGGSRTLNSYITGDNYQWQIDSGIGFSNLSDNATYGGTNTATLNIVGISNSSYGYKFRCLVDGIIGPEYWLRFINTWTGTSSTAWENTSNWSCGALPDANTDVTISSGNVVINSNVIVRSLLVTTGATVTVEPGFTLTITH